MHMQEHNDSISENQTKQKPSTDVHLQSQREGADGIFFLEYLGLGFPLWSEDSSFPMGIALGSSPLGPGS